MNDIEKRLREGKPVEFNNKLGDVLYLRYMRFWFWKKYKFTILFNGLLIFDFLSFKAFEKKLNKFIEKHEFVAIKEGEKGLYELYVE